MPKKIVSGHAEASTSIYKWFHFRSSSKKVPEQLSALGVSVQIRICISLHMFTWVYHCLSIWVWLSLQDHQTRIGINPDQERILWLFFSYFFWIAYFAQEVLLVISDSGIAKSWPFLGSGWLGNIHGVRVSVSPRGLSSCTTLKKKIYEKPWHPSRHPLHRLHGGPGLLLHLIRTIRVLLYRYRI
jgi:hypothetical protein